MQTAKSTYTLTEAMALAAADVSEARTYAEATFGPGLFDAAVAHHEARKLRAILGAGETRDCAGLQARFVGGHACPAEHVWFDFFRGPVLNSVSRLSRGLKA